MDTDIEVRISDQVDKINWGNSANYQKICNTDKNMIQLRELEWTSISEKCDQMVAGKSSMLRFNSCKKT